MLYHWLGWISLAICVVLLMKYIGRISKVKTVNQLLRKIHKPFGLAIIVVAALHGILSLIKSSHAVMENATGIILFLIIILLARTFYVKEKLRAKWFQMHRHLATVMLIMMITHIIVAVF